MSSEKRKLGLFGVTGILVAALIIAGFIFAGNVFQAEGKGVLTIQVIDAPVELKNLNVTIDWVRIHGEGGWINDWLCRHAFPPVVPSTMKQAPGPRRSGGSEPGP